MPPAPTLSVMQLLVGEPASRDPNPACERHFLFDQKDGQAPEVAERVSIADVAAGKVADADVVSFMTR